MPANAPKASTATLAPGPSSVPPGEEQLPILTSRDLALLFYCYPMQWAARIFKTPFFRFAQWAGGVVSWWLLRGNRRITIKRMQSLLKISAVEAKPLAFRFFENRIRAALFDLRDASSLASLPPADLVGKHHLDRALADGRGVILITMHCLAKREARIALEQAGITYTAVIKGMDRSISGHGRLLKNQVSKALVPMQMARLNRYILRDEPDTALRIASVLRDGGLIMITPDARQASLAREVPFVDGAMYISTAALDVARLTGASVIPFSASYPDGRSRIEFQAPLSLRPGAKDSPAAEHNRNQFIAALEHQIKTHPDRWEFWDRPHVSIQPVGQLAGQPTGQPDGARAPR